MRAKLLMVVLFLSLLLLSSEPVLARERVMKKRKMPN